jgi:hypothetical protein
MEIVYNKNIKWNTCFDDNNKDYHTKYIDITNIDNSSTNIDYNKLNNNINFSINNELMLKKIEAILNSELDKYENLYELVKDQNVLSSYLDKYILQNNIIIKIFVIDILQWLLESSIYLSSKLNLSAQYHNNVNLLNITSIPRCSYKFCSFKENCSYNYDKTKKGCYSDHYVYNMLTADIKVIIDYINVNYNKVDEFTYNKELLKCINTLNFVIKHMYDEYHSICMTKNISEYNSYFVNNKIVEKKFKKKTRN